MNNSFWLYRWIDEVGIKSERDASKIFKPGNARAIHRLGEIASEDVWTSLKPFEGSQPAILAGRGIDLSGDLDCLHRDCQMRQVDELLGKVLLYFDQVVVSGLPAHRFTSISTSLEEATAGHLREHIALLLYLRWTGVEGMLSFVQKPPACSQHLEQHATEAGLLDLVENAAPWIDRLVEGGTVTSVVPHEDHWHFQFDHPELEHSVWDVVTAKAEEPSHQEVAEVVFARYVSHLVSDVAAARALHLPLGAAVRVHDEVLGRTRPKATASDIAFDLDLPILDKISIPDVVELRNNERESFLKFRQAIRLAIEERISQGDAPAEVAEAIRRDVIEPALVDITARMQGAKSTLSKKIGTAAAFGVVATTIGLLGGAPLVVGAGVAAMGTSVSSAQKYLDDRGSIELSDLYFLWRLVGSDPTHSH